MLYVIPAATFAMLGFMAWLTIFRLRRDVVVTKREQTRGRFAFLRPKDRVRFLLKQSFALPAEKPDWEEPLVGRLPDVKAPVPAAEPTAPS